MRRAKERALMFCAGFVLVVVWLFVAIFAEPSPEPVRFTHFMVHHTDTPAKTERGKPYPQFDKSRCDEMARARGWDECGYNFLVERDGLIFKARPLWKKGAHCPNDGMNRHAISAAFVLRGTEEKPSRKALDAMLGIYEWMNSSLGYKLILTFHGDHAKTICPSNNVREAMRDEVR